MRSEILGGFEKGSHVLLADALLQGVQFGGTGAGLNVFSRNRMLIVNEEDQPRFIRFDRAVVLHLGD